MQITLLNHFEDLHSIKNPIQLSALRFVLFQNTFDVMYSHFTHTGHIDITGMKLSMLLYFLVLKRNTNIKYTLKQVVVVRYTFLDCFTLDKFEVSYLTCALLWFFL